jgi:hypothetical protein
MSRNAGRAIAASCTLFAVVGAGIVIYTAFVGDRAVAQVIPDVGMFRAGSELGEDRAGFTGRHKLFVFVSPGSPEWPALEACLQGEAVTSRMEQYVGIFVDPVAEPEVEETLRKRDGLQVVIRALNGALLGGLKSGFSCDDLVKLLESVSLSTPFLEKSPIYARLLESSDPITALKAEGNHDVAVKYVELLKEFEGASSPAVQAAEAEMNK